MAPTDWHGLFARCAGTLTTLHHFAGPDGANPNAGVIQGLDGRLYGTTTNGGAFGYGTVFVMNVTGGLTTLHDFALSDGANPVNELIQANDGAFYGAAPIGGPTGGGVIFRVRLATSPPDQYVEIVSRHSGQCLDVYGGSTEAAASRHPVDLPWRCESTVAARAGRRRRRSDHRAPQRAGARRLWRAAGRRHTHHSVPVAWRRQPGWTLEPASNGYVRIVARHSGKAMDVECASTDEGARVIQYTPHGGANQQWLLRPVE